MRVNPEAYMAPIKSARQEMAIDRANEKTGFIEDRLIVCEMMNQVMYELLLDKGVTREMIIDKLDSIIEKRKANHYSQLDNTCPKCSKAMVITKGNPFRMRCMYCNAEKTVLPYDKYEN